jgi:FkbM family methyltransferase
MKLLKYDKSVPFSFIAQCLPVFSDWVKEFKKYVENLHNKDWFDAILDNTNLNQLSGFSEYETLGTFFVNNYIGNLLFNKSKWERNGNLLCPIDKIYDFTVISDSPSFVTYESWQPSTALPSLKFKKFKNENEFLFAFFNEFHLKKCIIQVGANDGVMSDPLYEYLTLSKYDEISVILIEPLDYYFTKLKKLHKNRPNTILLNAALSNCESLREFYYINPTIAFEMNGSGPKNDWAHGQGSFYKESVEYWIDQNAFRGHKYIENIPTYKNSIFKTLVNCIPLKNIYISNTSMNLLVIDVQGAELEILLGVDWSTPPDFIYYEQDIKREKLIDELLLYMGFEYLCGDSNIVMYNTKSVFLVD